jgi:hypothetical protein
MKNKTAKIYEIKRDLTDVRNSVNFTDENVMN